MEKPNRIYYLIVIYLLFVAVLTGLKIRQYDWNPSALIGIWEGFAELNTNYVEKGTVLFKDSGYDGQFFYFNARYLFDPELAMPKVDSFYFRFHRIGLSVAAGFLASITGFSHYAVTSFAFLTFMTVLTTLLLSRITGPSRELTAYLFNPFVISSAMLLVSDSLFVSMIALTVYFFIKSGVLNNGFDRNMFFYAVVFSGLAVFVRETGIMFSGTLFLLLWLRRQYSRALAFAVPVLLFFAFVYLLRTIDLPFKGVNPVGFFAMVDWPFNGFVQAIEFNLSNPKSLIVYAVFLYLFLTALTFRNIHDLESLVLHLPLIGTVFIAAIGEKSYWVSYDNITRMFAPVMVWVILLKYRYMNYRDYNLVNYTILFTLLLLLRLIIQKPLPFTVY